MDILKNILTKISQVFLTLSLAIQPAFAGSEANWKVLGDFAEPAQEDTPEDIVPLWSVPGSVPAPSSFRMVVEVFKKPVGLGVDKEFVLFSVDGQLENVSTTSTARNGKYTIEGNFPLSIAYQGGKADWKNKKPWPWRRSSKYANSPMFWGLHIRGGYWMHSTPHYGELGRPASMGCVRLHFPAAMNIWDAAVNRVNGSAQIRIYASGSKAAQDAWTAHGLDSGWVNDRLTADLAQVHEISETDYNGTAHAFKGEKLVIPSCGGVDCYDFFGIKRSGI